MSQTPLEEQMQAVIDREAIRSLPLRYCHCVWQKDFDGYVDLFTEDGTFGTDDPSLAGGKGHVELRAMISDAVESSSPRPFIHNHVIDLAGPDQATGTCYVEVHVTVDGKPWEIRGWYHDEYLKVEGEWRFKSRQLTTDSFAPKGQE